MFVEGGVGAATDFERFGFIFISGRKGHGERLDCDLEGFSSIRNSRNVSVRLSGLAVRRFSHTKVDFLGIKIKN